MPPDATEAERGIAKRIPAAEHPTGHDLLAIDAWLPGTRPTEYAIELTTGPRYRARYWRCRACGAERSRPDEFDAVCPGGQSEPVATDGGYPLEEDLTRSSARTGARTGRCLDASDVDRASAHLERPDEAPRTGELPGPIGRSVD